MNIVVLHGEYFEKIYKRLALFKREAKKRKWETINIDLSSDINLPEILSSKLLFSGNALYLAENVNKISKKNLEWLRKNSQKIEGTLILYLEGKIPANILKSLPQPQKIEEYKISRDIFNFLESIYPDNSEGSIRLFHECLQEDSPDFTFAMIVRHFRDLVWVKTSPSTIPYSSWRVTRLEQQSNKFELSQIKNILKELSKLDMMIKTGKQSTLASIDLLLLTQLQ